MTGIFVRENHEKQSKRVIFINNKENIKLKKLRGL
jgi:hypothetical protein